MAGVFTLELYDQTYAGGWYLDAPKRWEKGLAFWRRGRVLFDARRGSRPPLNGIPRRPARQQVVLELLVEGRDAARQRAAGDLEESGVRSVKA